MAEAVRVVPTWDTRSPAGLIHELGNGSGSEVPDMAPVRQGPGIDEEDAVLAHSDNHDVRCISRSTDEAQDELFLVALDRGR